MTKQDRDKLDELVSRMIPAVNRSGWGRAPEIVEWLRTLQRRARTDNTLWFTDAAFVVGSAAQYLRRDREAESSSFLQGDAALGAEVDDYVKGLK